MNFKKNIILIMIFSFINTSYSQKIELNLFLIGLNINDIFIDYIIKPCNQYVQSSELTETKVEKCTNINGVIVKERTYVMSLKNGDKYSCQKSFNWTNWKTVANIC